MVMRLRSCRRRKRSVDPSMETSGVGKSLIVIGAILIFVGVLFVASDRWTFLKSIGRLPGDLNWQGEGWRVHVPLMTSLILSLLLSGIFWLISWFSSRGGR